MKPRVTARIAAIPLHRDERAAVDAEKSTRMLGGLRGRLADLAERDGYLAARLVIVLVLLLGTAGAFAAVRSGGPYEIQNETMSLGGGVSSGDAGGIYAHEGSAGGFSGVSMVSGTVAAQGYIAQMFPQTGPEVVLGLPTGFSTVEMTLNGYVNPRGQETTAVFEYGTTASYGLSASVTLSPNNGTADQVVSVALPGLMAGEMYHYRLSATNGEGTNRTDDGTFTVSINVLPPMVTARPATEITTSSARLNGLISPNGYAATAAFAISTDGINWTTIPALPGAINSTVAVGVTAQATGLEPNKLYQCRLLGTHVAHAASTSASSVIHFTTAPDPPIVETTHPTDITTSSATLNGTVRTKNRQTTVWFEYGPSSQTPHENSTPPQIIEAGTASATVTAPITNLAAGFIYYYRMRASNSGGSAATSSVGFNTSNGATAAPTITPFVSVPFSPTQTYIIGTVNPNGGFTTLRCEYGTTAQLGSQIEKSLGNLSAPQLEILTLTDLLPGTLYHYRVVAENDQDVTETAIDTFTTPFPRPVAVTGASFPLSTTSAQVSGTVQARNAATQVFFDYGKNGENFPNSVSAVPAMLSGDVSTAVSATLPNLQQGTTYIYRVRAVSSGGTSLGEPGAFDVSLISGLLREFPALPPSTTGTLTVHLTASAGALTGWRLVGEQSWRTSGSTATGLTAWRRGIEFRPVPGHIQPPDEIIDLSETEISRDYFLASGGGGGTGGISVTLKPDAITSGTGRAQWRLVGEDETQWRDSGAAITGLIQGGYLVESKPVTGRATPPMTSVSVTEGQTAISSITYFLPTPTSGALSQPLRFIEDISTDNSKPYAFVGQIRSAAGSSSGFVVKPRVVATAAHVVMDDGRQINDMNGNPTLASVQGLQWLFQRHAAVHEPRPITPRGYYVFTGYAAQRILDDSPGESTPPSQHLDVAALYFQEDAGRSGYSGYLASDLRENEHLLSNAHKMLVGYMIEGIELPYQGIMHATAPFNAAFSPGYIHPQDGVRTFTTTGLRGSGGGSGGPLCIQRPNGDWYPAAIFLGGTNQTVVRSIDSAVIDLFNRAQISGQNGVNNTGGGITHTGFSSITSATAGSVKVLIEPARARNTVDAQGYPLARWRLASTTPYYMHNAERTGLSPSNGYTLQMTHVPGFELPSEAVVTVSAGQRTTITYTYVELLTPQESWRQTHFGSTANSGNAADNADPDGDGFTNAAEYAAGTNPTVTGDFLKVTDAARSGETFSLSTAGKAGRTYHLERSANLNNWTTVTSNGPVTVDGPVTLTDPSSTGGAAFYRIRVTGP